MDTGDYVALAEAVGLAGTWLWVLRRNVERQEIRRKLALYAFGAASLSIILDLILTVILHFHQNPDDDIAARAWLILFPSGALTALIGLVLGLIGKGTPRIAAVVWSLVMLISVAITVSMIP